MKYYVNNNLSHAFEKRGRYYWFGVNTLAVFEISHLAFEMLKGNSVIDTSEILRSYSRMYNRREIEETVEELNNWKMVSDAPIEIFREPTRRNPYMLCGGDRYVLTGMYLVLTNECNLRCKYCSAGYGKFGIGDARGNMTTETAKKSVDFLLAHMDKNNKRPVITFVGGEPLLNFEVLRFVVDYLKKMPDYEPAYMFNTNGTLMKEDTAKWLVENDIPFRFSIDGTREIHNSSRVFCNGKGTYDRVMKGLRNYLKYTKNGFSVQSSIPKGKQLVTAVHHLWSLGANFVNANIAAESPFVDSTSYKPTRQDWDRHIRGLDRLNTEVVNNIINHGRSRTMQNTFTYIQILYNKDKKDGMCGICRVVSVGTDGRLYPCQGLMGMQDYVIGDLHDGLRLDKIQDFGNVYVHYLDKCNGCWARKICGTQCIALSIEYGELGEEFEPSRWCYMTKCGIETSIHLYSVIKDKDPQLLNKLFSPADSGHLKTQ